MGANRGDVHAMHVRIREDSYQLLLKHQKKTGFPMNLIISNCLDKVLKGQRNGQIGKPIYEHNIAAAKSKKMFVIHLNGSHDEDGPLSPCSGPDK